MDQLGSRDVTACPFGYVRRHSKRASVVFLLAVCAGLILSSSALGDQVLHYKETFGGPSGPSFLEPTSLAVDEATGDLLVMDGQAGTINRFDPNGLPVPFAATGSNVLSGTNGSPPESFSFSGFAETEIAVDNSGGIADGDIYVSQGQADERSVAIFSRSGDYLGTVTQGQNLLINLCGLATDPNGDLYVGAGGRGIEKFTPGANVITNSSFTENFPLASGQEPVCQLAGGRKASSASFFSASGAQILKQNSSSGVVEYVADEGSGSPLVAINPSSGNLLDAVGGSAVEVREFDVSQGSALELSHVELPSSVTGLTAGVSGLVYVARSGSTTLEVFDHVPTPTVTASRPTEADRSGSIKLNGLVDPEGLPVESCRFEYGPVNAPGFSERPCRPSASDLPADSQEHPIFARLAGLQLGRRYKFRITATNANGQSSTPVQTFLLGTPELTETRSLHADEHSATLEATIDPHGFSTSYTIEWGPTAAFGHIAATGLLAGALGPTKISAPVVGLTAGILYHFRVVATNEIGSSTSLSRGVEVLNSCGLPQGRCFELVSPPDVGPVARPGARSTLKQELGFQASNAPGLLDYTSEGGFPGATRGAEVLYQAQRGPEGWGSTQLSPGVSERDETSGGEDGIGSSSRTLALSPDLTCGVVESNQLLTPDPSSRLVKEAGGQNLYRQEGDNFTAISELPPTNPRSAPADGVRVYYHVVGISRNCSKVVFTSVYRFPGTGAVGEDRLYEWEKGNLRSVGKIPGPSGDVDVEAVSGGLNAVSADGSRVFFTDPQTSTLYVREDGLRTRDVSPSETSAPQEGATYQYSTADGSNVFFTANAGLTDDSTQGGGKDLYRFDLEESSGGHPLTDLSIATGSEEVAGAAGVLGSSEDGSQVYFAASGQLVPGEGPTVSENEADGTISIYLSTGTGETLFIASVGLAKEQSTLAQNGLLTNDPLNLSSRVSPDGNYLLFESDKPLTAYRSGGAPEAYLYDAQASVEKLTCVSCRVDGSPSVVSRNPTVATFRPLARPVDSTEVTSPPEPITLPLSLTMASGAPSIVFASADPLAIGASEGLTNLYEWSHGQIFLIATEPPGLQGVGQQIGVERNVVSLGADAKGYDLYFVTPATLSVDDGDERSSVYDARVGGGFPQSGSRPSLCDPIADLSCQDPVPEGPSVPNVGSVSATVRKVAKRKRNHHHSRRHKKHGKNRHNRRHDHQQGQKRPQDTTREGAGK